jgi:hypothetical protein
LPRHRPAPPLRLRRRLSPAGFVVAASALLLLGWGALIVLQAAFYPWARSLTGAPTLTGSWLGELTTPTGMKQLVWFRIRPPYRACANCPKITGEASTCDGRGPVLGYRFSGNAADWRGTQFTLKLTELEDGAAALRLTFLDGSWSGDRLDLTTTLIAPGQPTTMRVEWDALGRETTTVLNAHPDTRAPITFAMHRAEEAEFDAACVRLAPQPAAD